MNEDNPFDMPEEDRNKIAAILKARRRRLKEAFSPEIFKILEDKFETNLPCFQGKKGQYDPLDAMRRDAQRELLLWVRTEIELHEKDHDNQ